MYIFQPEVKKVFLVPASSSPIPQPHGLPTSNWWNQLDKPTIVQADQLSENFCLADEV